MSLAAVSETIGLVGAITGIVSGVVGTAIAVLSYRRQAVRPPPAPTVLQPAAGAAAPAPAAPLGGRGLRISVKAAVSALLGIVATIYAGLVSLAASLGEDAAATADLASAAFGLAVVALALGLLARRDIKRHPERRGKLVAGMGIATAAMAMLVALGATATEPAPAGPIDDGASLRPSRTSVGQSLSVPPDAGAQLVAQQIHPQLQAQLQARFPQVLVTVDAVRCAGSAGGGTCTAEARDSAGGSEAVEIEYTVVDPATGAFVWQTR